MKTKRERFEERQQALRELHGHNWRNVCHLDMGGDSPPPPDYTPVANASKEAAEISAQLGREQLDESRRQYEQNIEIARPIVDAQKRNMDQAYEQGAANYESFKAEGRPLQQLMRDEAMGVTSPTKQRLMDEAAATAIADARAGTTQQMNQLIRQGARYGWSPAKIAATGTSAAMMGASSQVAAANASRNQAGDKYYGRLGDVYNTYAGLGSSAPSFYSAGTNSGNSAVTNQMAPGGAMMAGMNAGASTTMNGRQIAMTGLTGVLNSQTNYANALSQMDSGMGGLGAVLGGGAKLYSAFAAPSDRRLKENIVLVGKDEATGLNLYEFNYTGNPTRFRGVMADEVEPRFPDAVVYDDMGFASVNYQMLGIEFEEVK